MSQPDGPAPAAEAHDGAADVPRDQRPLDPTELPQLLTACEQSVFQETPARSLALLGRVLGLAQESGRTQEARAAAWLTAVVLGSTGRYGEALDLLDVLLAEEPVTARERLVSALAGATWASLHRQLGQHATAQVVDSRALAWALQLGPIATEAALDCLVGLSADAVGQGDPGTAAARLAEADALIAARPEQARWRPRVRVEWVRAETALLTGDAVAAAEAAAVAVAAAEAAYAPRHIAKSLLFLGVARATAGQAGASGTLRRAAALADQVEARPLVWPARAVLGALLLQDGPEGPDAAEGRACLALARETVRTVAAATPEHLAAPWLARPDLVALLSG